MKFDLSQKDIQLLNTVLSKEIAEIKVELHHSRNYEYRDLLKEREGQINAILTQFKKGSSRPIMVATSL